MLTDRLTHRYTDRLTHRKDKNYIPPLHTLYAGGIIITTSASKLGYSAHLKDQIFQGNWCSKPESAHKLSGVKSRNVSSQTFPTIVDRSLCVDLVRQHYSHAIYKQTGRKQVPQTLLPSMEIVADSNRAPDISTCLLVCTQAAATATIISAIICNL